MVNRYAVGFSWAENYWCNLLDGVAINGQPNTAQPIAVTAMVVLCLALGFFWWDFPSFAKPGRALTWTIRGSGVLSIGSAFLLLSRVNHDLATNLASAFGLIAMMGVFVGLYRMERRRLLLAGLVNLILVALNNYLYYTPQLIRYLPVVQKITFLSFLIWMSGVGWVMFKAVSKESVEAAWGKHHA